MASFTDVFDVKVFGAVRMVKAFGPLLIKAKGTICNIGSMATYFINPVVANYGAANSALEYFSHQMRMELDPFGVRVVHVSVLLEPHLRNRLLLPIYFILLCLLP
jgi:1-acylglycerone phosphate reductase